MGGLKMNKINVAIADDNQRTVDDDRTVRAGK